MWYGKGLLAHELAQIPAQWEDVSNDLKRVIESVELERYRFVEAERAKWEATGCWARGGPCAVRCAEQ